MTTVFIAIEIFSICTIFTAMAILITKDGAIEQKLMSYFLCGALIQNVGYLFELTAPTLESALISVKVQYLGSIFVPLFYCWFMFSYCYLKAPKKLIHLFAAIDFILLFLIFTFEQHTLYYQNYQWLTSPQGHHYLHLTYGPAYPVFLIFGCSVPYSLSVFALIRGIHKSPEQAASRKYKVILVLSLLPVFALLSYAGKLTYLYDLTPSVLGIVLSLVVILIWQSRTYDFKHLAADTLLNSMSDGVIALDGQKEILSYNHAAVKIFPQLDQQDSNGSFKDLKTLLEKTADETLNYSFTFNNRHYECHSKKILDDTGKKQGYVLLIIDVTDTKNYIEEIKRVREQAEKANAAKSEFLANMSHEIRTPMNAIVGLSDIIMEESAGRKLYAYASDIKSASQNLLAIINDILDLSKVEAGKMELILNDYYIKTTVDEIINMMDIAASQRGLLMKYEYDTSIPCQYNGDEGRIKQILINLLNNAIKFTQEGYVKITIAGKPGDTENEELLTFRVEDTGCGIRPEDQEKIFENFKQLDSKKDRNAEGTGLGLSITKHLVQLMNGTITLESEYRKGSVFTVTLPQIIVNHSTIEQMPHPPHKHEEEVKRFIAKGYRILIVDDNLINRRVAKGLLKAYQFDLEEAESGFEAIDLVKQNSYDIIFMDHMMPEMDGIEAVRRIRENDPEICLHTVIIALTANAMEGVRDKFIENGFQDYIAKPLNRRRLNELLDKWIPDERKQIYTVPSASQEGAGDAFNRLSIKGIDPEAAKKVHTGTMEEYKELLHLYCMDGKRKIVLLQELYEERNLTKYEIEVHALKSASANIGASKLSSLAKKHEKAASLSDPVFIEENFLELINTYQELLDDITLFLKEESDTTQVSFPAPSISEEEIINEIQEALSQLENFHSKDCLQKIDSLLLHNLPDMVRDKLDEIVEQLKLYEDDIAEKLLRILLQQIHDFYKN